MLMELGYGGNFGSVGMWGGITGTLSLAPNGGYSARIMRCSMRYYLLTELIASGEIKLCHVPSASQLADILTKALSKATYNHLVNLITNSAS